MRDEYEYETTEIIILFKKKEKNPLFNKCLYQIRRMHGIFRDPGLKRFYNAHRLVLRKTTLKF